MPLRLYGHPFLKPSNVRWLPMLGPSLRRWQRFQQAPVDQNLEVTRYAERECAISDENANFDVAVQGCFGQIRGGDKDGLVVGHDGLGMEYSRGAPELEGPGVKEHPRPGRTWPVCLPKTVGELAHKVVSGRRVAPRSLDVQKEHHAQLWYLVHALGQHFERLSARPRRRTCWPRPSALRS